MNEEELLQMLSTIDEKLELAKEGLLLYSELQVTQRDAELVLEKNIEKGTKLWRDYDRHKTISYWEKYPGKYTSETGRLELWKSFIIRTLEQAGASASKKQTLITKGQYFTGRKAIKEILKEAKNKIDIQDNYSNIELLNILETNVIENPSIKIRILTQKTNNSFKSDVLAFIKQYGSLLEVRTHVNCHDRFVFIDEEKVFHSGHSFKDLGSKASLISLVGDKEESMKIINEFENWWKDGVAI